MYSNLPPGVTESMLPGNRPEDVRAEKLIEDIEFALADVKYKYNATEEEIKEFLKDLYL